MKTLRSKWDALLGKSFAYQFVVGWLLATIFWSSLILLGVMHTTLPLFFPAAGIAISIFILIWLYITVTEPPVSSKPYRKYRG